jgi:hypothetical protein
MEINAGNSSVNIAISVQPKNELTQGEGIENSRGYEASPANYAAENAPNPSFNTRGEEVGNAINAWA